MFVRVLSVTWQLHVAWSATAPTMKTCLDVKKAYKDGGCCGMPTKTMANGLMCQDVLNAYDAVKCCENASAQFLGVQETLASTLSATYYSANQSNLPAGCNYELADLGTKVPDKCCALDGVTPDKVQFANGGKSYTCAPKSAGPAGFVRNFLGCVNGQVNYGESCSSAGQSLGSGYPMNSTTAATSWEYAADGSACGCGNPLPGKLDTIYEGTGCFVGISGYMLGEKDYTAFFVKVEGTCPVPQIVTRGSSANPTCKGSENFKDPASCVWGGCTWDPSSQDSKCKCTHAAACCGLGGCWEERDANKKSLGFISCADLTTKTASCCPSGIQPRACPSGCSGRPELQFAGSWNCSSHLTGITQSDCQITYQDDNGCDFWPSCVDPGLGVVNLTNTWDEFLGHSYHQNGTRHLDFKKGESPVIRCTINSR